MSLDATHAAMHYEQAFGGRRTGGSQLLRSFMAKFAGKGDAATENIWGDSFQGSGAARLTAQEQALRNIILDGSMSRNKTTKVLTACNHIDVWPTRIQFVEAVAALASVHQDDLSRKIEGHKTTIGKMLYALTAPEKMEWLFNNLRYRQGLSSSVRSLLPSGTTGNEALHAELNSWFRQESRSQ